MFGCPVMILLSRTVAYYTGAIDKTSFTVFFMAKWSFLHTGKPITSLHHLYWKQWQVPTNVTRVCLDAGVIFTPKYQQQHAVKPVTCRLRHEFVYLVFCSLRWHAGPRPVSCRQSTGDRDSPPSAYPPGATQDEKERLWYFPKDPSFSGLSQQCINKNNTWQKIGWLNRNSVVIQQIFQKKGIKRGKKQATFLKDFLPHSRKTSGRCSLLRQTN